MLVSALLFVAVAGMHPQIVAALHAYRCPGPLPLHFEPQRTATGSLPAFAPVAY